MTDNQISISTYHEYILEAIRALRIGLEYNKDAKLVSEEIGSDSAKMLGEMHCRYAFLMIANSIEAAANALLLSLDLVNDYYMELERISTLVKFKLFCDFCGKRLDQSDIKYSRIKEIITCRNEFVHPKPRKVNAKNEDISSEFDLEVKMTQNRKYPTYIGMIKSVHVLSALEDTLSFISWICYDICEFDIQEGAFKLGLDVIQSNGDIIVIGEENNKLFDRRTFGIK